MKTGKNRDNTSLGKKVGKQLDEKNNDDEESGFTEFELSDDDTEEEILLQSKRTFKYRRVRRITKLGKIRFQQF